MSTDKVTSLCLPQTHDFEILSVFIDSRIDKTVLDCFPNLKCVATRSTGYDHVDVEECKKRGITVVYVPGYGDNTVAEFAFGLMLNLTRKIYMSIDRIKEIGSFSLEGLQGMDLKGKTMGIVGTGRIGKEAIRIAQGFGMKVIAYDPFPDIKFAEASGIAYMPLDEVLKNSDTVSIHCPYNPSTHHLLNKNNMPLMKPGSYLVNTARGAIIETDALLAALKDKRLAGYAADVLEEEGDTKDELNLLQFGNPKEAELRTMLENYAMMKMPNVLITPHNAFNTREALMRILNTTIENIRSYLKGAPTNIVK
ncbi:MAG: NAD(P)-dependent oxidoreductase [bacterium]|nr:NAD(P)-dependent oxidoreductase [bacterium]